MSSRCRWVVFAVVLLGVVFAVATPAGADPPAPGVAWSVTDHLTRASSPSRVVCPGVAECWAMEGGLLLQTTDGGVTWTDRSALLPDDLVAVGDLACPAAGTCFVTATTDDADVLVAIAGGTSNTRRIPVETTGLRIDCPTTTACVTTDGALAARTSDAGSTWIVGPLPGRLSTPSLSCAPSTGTCWIVGNRDRDTPVLDRSADGGRTWAAPGLPARFHGQTRFDDVACVNATTCSISGASHGTAFVTRTRNGGQSLVDATLPAGPNRLYAISCVAAACRAVGYTPAAGVTDAASPTGTTWTTHAVDPSSTDVLDIACAAVVRCVAVGIGSAYRLAGADHHWVRATLPTALQEVTAVSCAGVPPCVGLGHDARQQPRALHGAPGAWVETAAPAGILGPGPLDCAAPTHCVLFGSVSTPVGGAEPAVWRTTDYGVTWRRGTLPGTGAPVLSALDCPSALVCLGYGTASGQVDGLRTTDGGATWTTVAGPPNATNVRSVSCLSTSVCVVPGYALAGPVIWRTPDLGTTAAVTLDSPRRFDSFGSSHCAGTACFVLSGYKRALVDAVSSDGGRTWGFAPDPPIQAGDADLHGLNCSPAGRCALLADPNDFDAQPRVSTDNGLTWRADSFPDDLPYDKVVGCTDTRCFGFGADDRGRLTVAAEPF